VNLIGEHTDYNDGFVLPIAIDKAVYIALGRSDDQVVTLYSKDLDNQIQFDLQNLKKAKGWGEYIKGVVWALQEQGHRLKGWNGVLTSDIPQGAGLSSSAAVEMAVVSAFDFSSNLNLSKQQMAMAGRRAENDWVGVKSGIMDQMTSSSGVEGHALLIDCRTLETQTVPLPEGISIVVMDTTTRHKLVDSAYNDRRQECNLAAKLLNVPALRDATIEKLQSKRPELDEVIAKRAMHVISENQRVLDAVEALRRGDAIVLGRLINESHVSLRDQFEVSSDALNKIVECAIKQPGCLGARMMGAGFGGCAIAIVRDEYVDGFRTGASQCYFNKTGLQPVMHSCRAVQGASFIKL
jgi:galactokinase